MNINIQSTRHENLVPIIDGVTGHRDLKKENIPGLGLKVRAIFKEIRRKYTDTPVLDLKDKAKQNNH